MPGMPCARFSVCSARSCTDHRQLLGGERSWLLRSRAPGVTHDVPAYAHRMALTGRWLVTGWRGTLAPRVAREIAGRGAEPIGWDRDQAPADDPGACQAYLDAVRPAGILHLGMGSAAWAAQLAGYARDHDIPFGFTSTVMVFGTRPGPYRVGDEPSPAEEYGAYKVRCEKAVAAADPDGVVARIGWQIDESGIGNNMLAQLDAQAQTSGGMIRANAAWIPACSWMRDTARSLLDLVCDPGRRGLAHLDSNSVDAWAFPEVVRHVARVGCRDWVIEEVEDGVHDQRLLTDEPLIARLSERPGT